MRALNGETASAWSVPATGSTGSAANTAPAGAPAIDDGTPVEGAVLGVDVSGITDEDGLSSPDYAYQWEREAAGVWTGVAGASGGSYRVGAADVGAKLRVRVSFTDDGGTRETLTSAATETVLPFVMTGVCPLQDLTGRNEVWRAVLTVGDGASTNGFVSNFGIGALSDAEFEYESKQFTIDQFDVLEKSAGGLPKGTLSFILTRQPSDTAEKRLRLHVCGEVFDLKDNRTGSSGGLTTFQWNGAALVWRLGERIAVALSETRNTPATGRPSVTGAAVTGQTLSADRSAIADADGTTQADAGDAGYAWAYQWVHVDGMTETDITGATGDTYTPTAADEGKLVAVRVTFTDDLDYGEAVTSEPVGPVSDEAPDATGQPVIDGTPQDGQELTTGKGDMADTDDLPATTFPTGYTFQWVRVVGGTDTDIDGATDDTYTPGPDDVGHPLKVEVSFIDGGGTGETLASAATAAVVAAPEDCVADRPDSEWCTTLTVGENQASSGTSYGFRNNDYGALDDPDFDLGPESYTVQGLWIRDADDGNDGVVIDFSAPPGRVPHGPVFNFGGTTFTANAASEHSSENTRYRWNRPADFEWLDGQKVTVSMKIPNTPATGVPTVTGAAVVGETLTADTSDIADDDGLGNATFIYRWVRDNGGTETDIGADSASYTVATADVGGAISVEVSFKDDRGFEEGPLASIATAPVQAQAVPVTIAANHAKIGAGLEDLVFTLTRSGATTDALDVTVTLEQPSDKTWLADADLSHTVTFAVDDDTATLTLGHRKFSLDPDASGDLTATVGGQGTGGPVTVEMISIADPPITVAYDMDSYSFAEDADPEDVEVYVTVTVDPAYPRGPSSGIGFSVNTHSGTAKSQDDFLPISDQAGVAQTGFSDDGGSPGGPLRPGLHPRERRRVRGRRGARGGDEQQQAQPARAGAVPEPRRHLLHHRLLQQHPLPGDHHRRGGPAVAHPRGRPGVDCRGRQRRHHGRRGERVDADGGHRQRQDLRGRPDADADLRRRRDLRDALHGGPGRHRHERDRAPGDARGVGLVRNGDGDRGGRRHRERRPDGRGDRRARRDAVRRRGDGDHRRRRVVGRRQQRPDGGGQRRDDERGHGLRIRRVGLRLLGRRQRRRAGERQGRLAAGVGHGEPVARRDRDRRG